MPVCGSSPLLATCTLLGVVVCLAGYSPQAASGERRHATDEQEGHAERRERGGRACEGQGFGALLGGAWLGGLRGLGAGKDGRAVERGGATLASYTVAARVIVTVSGSSVRIEPVRVRRVGAEVLLRRRLRGEVIALLSAAESGRSAKGDNDGCDRQCAEELWAIDPPRGWELPRGR